MSDFLTAFLGAGLGGGLVVAWFTAWHVGSENQKARRADYLSRQIEELYGPLSCLCELSVGIRAQSVAYSKAMSEVLSRFTEPALDFDTHTAIEKETSEAGKLLVDYGQQLNHTQSRIVAIVNEKYALADLPDAPTLIKLLVNIGRAEVEFQDGQWRIPFRIYDRLEPNTYYLPEFAETIRARYRTKASELEQLRERRSSCWQWVNNRIHWIKEKV